MGRAFLAKHFVYEADYRAVAFVGTMAALQQADVTALEAEGEDIEADIGASLEDDAYHAERHTDASQVETIGKRPLLTYNTQRRRQSGHVAKVGSDASDAFRRELQAVIERVAWRQLLAASNLAVSASARSARRRSTLLRCSSVRSMSVRLACFAFWKRSLIPSLSDEEEDVFAISCMVIGQRSMAGILYGRSVPGSL